MSTEKNQQKQDEPTQPLAQPSDAPLKNEPTPERAREEKAKQEDEACRKGV